MKQCATFALAALALAGVQAFAAEPLVVVGPYKHLAMWKDDSHAIAAAPDGMRQRYIAEGRNAFGPGVLSWAFATGECGAEKWGDEDAQAVADANVAAFEQAGAGYIISTGGQGGVFTCASDAGMERFIARYASSRLVGIDFDIEAGQSAAQVDAIARRIKVAQKKHPQLRFSFTIATHAASDGSMRSLNREGEAILRAVRRHGLRGIVFNLMVMDYGDGKPAFCVVKDGVCDMGRSAIQAARNVNARYRIPFSQIELTPMIGVNDVVSNVFTLDDARMVAGAVRELKLAGLHYWSLDRDTPCGAPVSGASPTCSTLDVKSGEYRRAFARAMP
ncbi:MAG: glycosyl hydrolase [Massilia sp.]|nr:glycosyl hydrolase [Massilia sp.]